MTDDGESEDSNSRLREVGVYSALAIELAGFVFVGVLAGRYVDRRFGVGPLGLLIGLFGALAAAGVHIWKLSEAYVGSDETDSRDA